MSLINFVASLCGAGGIQAFKTMRTLRALRPLRAMSRMQGMRVCSPQSQQTLPIIFFIMFPIESIILFAWANRAPLSWAYNVLENPLRDHRATGSSIRTKIFIIELRHDALMNCHDEQCERVIWNSLESLDYYIRELKFSKIVELMECSFFRIFV